MLAVAAKVCRGDFCLDLRVAFANEITVVFGASGAGKSTVLKVLAGLLTPNEGNITFAGTVWFDSARRINLPAKQRRIGIVLQDLALFPHRSVADNVAYGLFRLSATARRERVKQMLKRLGIERLAARMPVALSGGEKQRVALARALAIHPRLLLLDEPLTGLDEPTRAELLEEIRRLRQEQQIPLILVTHRPSEARSLASRVIVLEAGKVISDGTATMTPFPRVESLR